MELEPRSHRYRGALAVALLASGYQEPAREEGNRALAMAREAGDQQAVQELQGKMGGALSPP